MEYSSGNLASYNYYFIGCSELTTYSLSTIRKVCYFLHRSKGYILHDKANLSRESWSLIKAPLPSFKTGFENYPLKDG
jgi:hypothetical protein